MRRRLAAGLTDRDHELLELLRRHRFLTTHQLQAFCFEAGAISGETAGRSARRAVRRLAGDRLIQSVLPRRVGGLRGGAAPGVWQLTDAGHAVIRHDGRRHRAQEPSLRFLEHTLALADAHLLLRAAATAMDGTLTVQIEGEAVRRFASTGGGSAVLAPDLYGVITARDDHGPYEDHWFVEVDCGSESIPTLLRKCDQYAQYRASGLEQAHTGTFPLVLWILGGRRGATRAQALQQRLTAKPALDASLHRLAVPETALAALTSGGAL